MDTKRQAVTPPSKAGTINSLQAQINAKVQAAMSASQRSDNPRTRRVA